MFKKALVFIHDLAVSCISWFLVVFVRFNFEAPPSETYDTIVSALPIVLLAQSLMNISFGLYKGIWRFASLRDTLNIIKAAVFGIAMISVILFITNRLEFIPRTAIILYPIFLIGLLTAPRFAYRLVKDNDRRLNKRLGIRTLIIGAGMAGESIARDMLRGARYNPIGFIDDDNNLRGSVIHGIPIIGKVLSIASLVKELDIKLVIIAIPTASASQMRVIIEQCSATNVRFLTLPKLNDIVEGHVDLGLMREVSIDDLLGREQIVLNWRRMQTFLSNKKILVTGGAGSIGKELCRQLLRINLSSLTIIDQSELGLHELKHDLFQHSDTEIKFVLGNVCDEMLLQNLFKVGQFDVVFHAAAYKHVPILQNQARIAVANNVLGTESIARISSEHGVGNFVLISTDKAVKPTNIMGASKRFAELIVQSLNCESKTRFMVVRFGNVLNSAGSVVPLFEKQIAKGGPVTVTHPEATRFFMSIPEACQLIMEASSVGVGGEVFVLDMGQPVSIAFLAEQMIKLSGRSVDVIFTGLREGEKLEEELFFDFEELQATNNEKLFLSNVESLRWDVLSDKLEDVRFAVDRFNEKKIIEILKEITQLKLKKNS